MHICTSLRSDSWVPPIVASTRYQTFSSDSTPLAIRSNASANRRAPIGSPCWTPVEELLFPLLNSLNDQMVDLLTLLLTKAG